MSTERNKILEILQEDIESTGDYDGGHYVEGREIAAKNIEALVLQSKIDENNSILEMAKLHMDSRAVMVIQNRISELSNQLKELSKTD